MINNKHHSNPYHRCPICNNLCQQYWAGQEYQLYRCFKCHFAWDPHPPQKPELLYQKNYYINNNPKGGYANYFEGMKINRLTFASRLKNIAQRCPKGSLLDVGCALGDCLLEARNQGWKTVEGIEPSSYACQFAKNRGLVVHHGTLSECYKKITQKYDVVLSQDHIEHAPDPLAELTTLSQLVKPGGLLYIVTCDVNGLLAKILKSYWYHYKPGEHFSYFSKQSLSLAMQTVGFTSVSIKDTIHIMSLDYVLNRLSFYSPRVFRLIRLIINTIGLGGLPIRSYTGMVECWGWKNAS